MLNYPHAAIELLRRFQMFPGLIPSFSSPDSIFCFTTPQDFSRSWQLWLRSELIHIETLVDKEHIPSIVCIFFSHFTHFHW